MEEECVWGKIRHTVHELHHVPSLQKLCVRFHHAMNGKIVLGSILDPICG